MSGSEDLGRGCVPSEDRSDSTPGNLPHEQMFGGIYPPDMNPADDNFSWTDDVVNTVKSWIGLDDKKEEPPKEEPKPTEEESTELEDLETPEEPKKDLPQEEDLKGDALVKSWQQYLAKKNQYSGPQDGKMNPQLEAALKQAEASIIKSVSAFDPARSSRLKGSIWNPTSKLPNTTPQDLEQAISLINDFQKQNPKLSSKKDQLRSILKNI